MSPASAHAAHFSSAEQQVGAARMGMWLFLMSELLLFAGLFVAYGVYRLLFPHTFAQASQHLDLVLGTVNTLVLITSSFTVALSVHFAAINRPRLAGGLLLFSAMMGVAFLVVKAREYGHHFETRALPGKYYGLADLRLPAAPLFFTLYFFMTGVHALHVLVGVGVLSVVGLRSYRGDFSAAYYTPVELGGMYWHLVDLIWIFLFPLLYLV